MEFPYTYFEDEVREGFYISGIIKRAWAAQLEVLAVVDEICKKHNIRWFADCGTLLGAVRHGGYIPWDDDLDICMLREDYMRFNEVAEQELPEGYVVLNLHKEEHYFEYLTRVANGHRLNFDEDFLDKYHNFPYASGIDIFPIDYISDDEEEEQQRKDLLSLVMATADEVLPEDENVDNYKEVLTQIEELCDVKFDYSRSVKQQLFETAEKLFALYSSVGGKNVALMPYWIYFDNHVYPAEYFDKTIMMPFETTELPVPAAYDGVLRIEYGDYMKIHKGGGVHGYPFFTGQEEHLMKLVPDYPFKYVFSRDDLQNNERYSYEGPKQQAAKLVALMEEAHVAIVQSVTVGRYQDAAQLLMACQNSAIQIGTMLEEHYGKDFVTVRILEEYCEILYQVYELLEETSNTDKAVFPVEDVKIALESVQEQVRNSVHDDVQEHREILFMPVKAGVWGALDSVWRAAKEDSNCSVYVMPVPYYERKATGTPGEMHYEGDMFPDYLDIIDYNIYDIERRHPDIIFIQNAYDQCNYTTSILPQFYSGNIKKHTDKLVYIPWFKLDEFDGEKAVKTMDYFCKVPGIVHADEVIVQSEQMRQQYIECMTKFAGDDTRDIWETKIKGYGTPLDDVQLCMEANKESDIDILPEKWRDIIHKKDGSIKKIVLYNTSVAGLMQYGQKMLDKMRKVLDTFHDSQSEIALIWRPHPLLKSAIISTMPELLDEYIGLVGQYCEAGWGIYDDTPDLDRTIELCDAYYGDADGVAHKCETLGKLVMLQNVEI